ncbi:MAG: hypothetical protein NVS2B9_05950 [Myxococcales bacterium]
MSRFARTSFTVSTEVDPDATRLILAGELDLATEPMLAQALLRAERLRPALLQLDLSRLTFIDVSGLAALLAAARRAEREGRSLQVVAASRPIKRLFALTALDQSIELA